MKRSALLLTIAVALISVAFLVFREKPSSGYELKIFLTADVRGRLVPCGCFTGQFGGLTRVSTVLGEPDSKSLRLDAGDALEGPDDFHRMELAYIHRAFAQMGYAAANLGHREARLSAPELRQLAQSSGVPLLSANLLDSQTGAPVAKSHTIVKRGGWRIAIVGVLDEMIPAVELGTGLRVEKMSTAIGQLLPALKKDADFLVLLAFTNQEQLARLAREFPEFTAVLGGKVTQPSQEAGREGKTALLYVTNESKALGTLRLRLDSPGDAALLGGDVMLVHHQIAEDREIEKLAIAYREEIRTTTLALDDPTRTAADAVPGVRSAPAFAGSESCTTCHAAAADVWKKSSHSHAFQTLVSRKADADPNCIGCHTVGFQKPGGYRREFGISKLTDVGCESCHGPASRHVERVKAGDLEGGRLRKLGAADCVKCHHGEFSRPFEWEAFWPLIMH
ncbi:MAG: hypothetical protein RL088_1861 [Verrucomicrobiota bacterium]